MLNEISTAHYAYTQFTSSNPKARDSLNTLPHPSYYSGFRRRFEGVAIDGLNSHAKLDDAAN